MGTGSSARAICCGIAIASGLWTLPFGQAKAAAPSQANPADDAPSAEFLALFDEWRAFEHPGRVGLVPDYGATAMAAKQAALGTFKARLAAIHPSSWPVSGRVDYEIVRAEMNGFDFSLRVLRPWARDPAFYRTLMTEQSDTPSHEAPTGDALIELWTYQFPLSRDAQRKLAGELNGVAPLLEQARSNLTGNARDLWIAGTGTMHEQLEQLTALETRIGPKPEPGLREGLVAAKLATSRFVEWLEQQAPSKSGPSGVGKENYTWNLRHVHLVPLTWDQEVAILKRELARAHSALRLEEQRNRGLPPLVPIATPEEYQMRANAAVTRLVAFLRERDILEIKDFHDPAMRAHIGRFVPEDRRNFFLIVSHHAPLALFTHSWHWWDHAYMRFEPNASPVRRDPLPWNIWDNRSEGLATAVEELLLHAGLYDDQPRARELVWIMLAQRCARGLASLYAQANEFDLQQAKAFQVRWTPRGWMRPDLDLLGFEQQLYLRQPGYGASYVTGKFLIDEAIKDRAAELGGEFSMRRFFAEFNAAGLIPVSLIRWQMTGNDDEIREINATP